MYPAFALGSWDETLAVTAELPEEEWLDVRQVSSGLVSVVVFVHVNRGRYGEASRIVDVFRPLGTSADVQEQAGYACGKSSLLLARGNPAAALEVAEAAFGVRDTMGISSEFVKEAFAIAVQAALELGDLDKAEALIASIDAMADPDFNLFALNTTTCSVIPGVFVNGPVRHELKIPYGPGCFGGEAGPRGR